MSGFQSITFGGINLYITSMTIRRVPSVVKQKIGKNIVNINIIGRDEFDYNISVSGMVIASDPVELEDKRIEIENLNDCEYHELVTGIEQYDGLYIMEPGSLQWDDRDSDAQMVYRYSFTLIQFNQ